MERCGFCGRIGHGDVLLLAGPNVHVCFECAEFLGHAAKFYRALFAALTECCTPTQPPPQPEK